MNISLENLKTVTDYESFILMYRANRNTRRMLETYDEYFPSPGKDDIRCDCKLCTEMWYK